jgi:UDP-N-acetyl-D-galactosamine dehydrogenase
MGQYVAQQLVKTMAAAGLAIHGARVLVMGLTFKENTPDLRNTRVVDIVDELESYGLEVEVYDPWADPAEARNYYGIDLLGAPVQGAYEAVIVAVAHREFAQVAPADLRALLSSRQGIIYDLKSVVPSDQANLAL